MAAIYSVGLGDMGQYVERFQAEHPTAKVQVEYLHPDQVYQRVRDKQADFGLVSFPGRPRDLTTVRVVGIGDFADRGFSQLGLPGLMRRIAMLVDPAFGTGVVKVTPGLLGTLNVGHRSEVAPVLNPVPLTCTRATSAPRP